jgi:hypothetical protein
MARQRYAMATLLLVLGRRLTGRPGAKEHRVTIRQTDKFFVFGAE